MEDVLPIILMGIGGLLVGGVVSAVKAKRVKAAVVLAVLSVVALAGAVMWWLPA